MNKLNVLVVSWVLILVVGLGTLAPIMVSAANSFAVIGGIAIAGISVWSLFKVATMILNELEKNNA